MREHHDHLGTFGPDLIDHLLHVVVLNAEGPVGHHITRIRNRRIRKGLANHRNRNAVLLTNYIRLEDWITKIRGLHILGQKLNVTSEILFDDFLYPLRAQREFPVGAHHIDPEQLAGIDHILTLGPKRGCRPLPGVTAI